MAKRTKDREDWESDEDYLDDSEELGVPGNGKDGLPDFSDHARTAIERNLMLLTEETIPEPPSTVVEGVGGIEGTIAGFMRKRIARLEREQAYIASLKIALMERLESAEFRDILSAITQAENNQSKMTQVLLSPFVSHSGEGDTTPLLAVSAKKAPEATQGAGALFSDLDKDSMKNMQALTEALNLITQLVGARADQPGKLGSDG